MSFLEELNGLITGLGLPVETGVFSGKAPDEYMVITPLADTFGLHADNRPQNETREARLSLFSKANYLRRTNAVTRALLAADFTITARRYIGHEANTGYHHYAMDAAKNFELQED
jgi:hypothetical protein